MVVRNGKKRRPGPKPTGQKTTTGAMSKELLRKVRIVAAHLGIKNSTVLDRYALPAINRIHRSIEAGKHIELGENGA
jgi:hypothetical protein